MLLRDYWDSVKKVGQQSSEAIIGTRVDVTSFNGKTYGMTSATPPIGSVVGVNGGLNKTAVYPDPCGRTFWTCKQGWLHNKDTEIDIVVDSAIQLFRLDYNSNVKDSIDLEPVIYSIIKNMVYRTDSYEQVAVASYWINPYYYNRMSVYESMVTSASPSYFDIPTSFDTQYVKYVGPTPITESRSNNPLNYIRPASYSGILGPVFAGVTHINDIDSVKAWPKSPWNKTNAPVDPCNIQVRDIKIDAKENLWIVLQVGWEYCRTHLSRQSGQFYDQELSTWIGYEDGGGYPNQAFFNNQGSFSRQYNPSGDITRAGPIRPRVFIVCFDKSTKYKTWDYLPFRPGTCGFNGLSREYNCRGPAIYGITVPPSRLDVDPYGNVYYSVGTADIWEGTPSPYNLHCYGVAKNEIGYLYVRPTSEKAAVSSPGLEVGRIGPYNNQCTIIAADTNTMAWFNKEIGNPNRPAFRAPWTWNIGGDRVFVSKTKFQSGIETWQAATFGNATAFRGYFNINPDLEFPHPYVNIPDNYGPCEIRSPDNEWLTYNPTLKCANRDTDLLFAACDYLTRNYSYLSSPSTYNCFDWWRHETKWTKGLNDFVQLHPQKECWFEVGSGDLEPYTGWLPSESPGFWYTHFTNIGGTWMEMNCRSYAITDQRGWFDRGFLPLFGAISPIQDTFFRVASTPYSQGYSSSTDFYDKNCVSGMLPTCVSRMVNEKTMIIPKYDFKHEIFTFTGQTWDTYDAIRSKFGIYTNTIQWPWRFHSMKQTIESASIDHLDPASYADRSLLYDPASHVFPTDYVPKDIDKMFYYDDTWESLWTDVASKMDREAVNEALALLNGNIANSKWHYFETGLTNLNYGAFISALYCGDTVAFMAPRYKLSVSFYDDEETGDYYIDLITDTRPLKRLYILTVNPKGDLTWKQKGTKKVKTWWERTKTWVSPASPIEVECPVKSVQYYDLKTDIIANIKKWNPALTVERYQQCTFHNWYPKGAMEPPQFY